jgi:hypothetical protein
MKMKEIHDDEIIQKQFNISNPNENEIERETLPSIKELLKQIMLTNDIIWYEKQYNKHVIDRWLSNFTGECFSIEYEHNLALWLLANFVYYNENEVRNLCKIIFQDFLHYMLKNDYLMKELNVNNAIESILNTSRFYYLGKPGESGPYILYYFRQENNLPIKYFIPHPIKLGEDTNNVVFVDDVSISGTQAEKYINRETRDLDSDKREILLTLISTEDVKKTLEKNGIEVISCITLDNRSKCFSAKSSIFYYFKEHRDNCKKFATYYGKKICSTSPLGYKSGEYLFGFYYNTPDNTLPIIWSDNGWVPIMKRYTKYLNKEWSVYNELGRYI